MSLTEALSLISPLILVTGVLFGFGRWAWKRLETRMDAGDTVVITRLDTIIGKQETIDGHIRSLQDADIAHNAKIETVIALAGGERAAATAAASSAATAAAVALAVREAAKEVAAEVVHAAESVEQHRHEQPQ